MNNFFKPLIFALTVSLLVSCNKNTDNDYPQYGAYVVVNVEETFYYFTGDDGKTYFPGDVSRIKEYDTEGKDGKRDYIRFNFLTEAKEGYDYNIALHDISDLLSKFVEQAETEDDVEKVGDDRLKVNAIRIMGPWLDIRFSLMTAKGITHTITLLDNLIVDVPTSMPDDYQYLEFRQLSSSSNSSYLAIGDIAYNLGAYAPSVTGKKGLYIRIKNLNGNVEYITVKYELPKENVLAGGKGPYSAKEWMK